ncbi:MAG: M1 family metallopeptidase, partial [Deltaproteobacteria bacterium]|nr:M1 family metallopeptidase [Deltaproteobacteria bacterium]
MLAALCFLIVTPLAQGAATLQPVVDYQLDVAFDIAAQMVKGTALINVPAHKNMVVLCEGLTVTDLEIDGRPR